MSRGVKNGRPRVLLTAGSSARRPAATHGTKVVKAPDKSFYATCTCGWKKRHSSFDAALVDSRRHRNRKKRETDKDRAARQATHNSGFR